MQISQQGLSLIKESEGLRLHPYGDPAGHQTIGYGHLIRPGEQFANGITEAQANKLLETDVSTASSYVSTWVLVELTQNQFDALVDFVFNLGPGNFHTSTLLVKLNSGNYAGAAAEFPKWIYAGGQPLPGLVIRRHKEQELFLKATP